ncbi:helix-turn-helix transcriptional regulator [Xenorhabdus bovienii]|uniref:XRE family transcriptional regulator n=1 Tax=Xenorhabdus bovienii TaxID=40576 RepID=UPI0023B32F53|nr:helix-turn-helix transcriptional regulator [Xenorhabdus bovienii]MDE9443805.1 helix-turn-helix transcriptional regulator [Xenorhabdus bovienii]
MKTTNSLSERLKLARTMAGMSQKKLGNAVGISQAAIQKIEAGLSQSSTKLIEIAKILSVNPDWLSTGDGDLNQLSQNNESIKQFTSETSTPTYTVKLLDIQASAGVGIMVNSEFIETIRSIEYTADEARSLFGGRSADSMKMITVNGDSMSGTFEPRDQIFVDITKNYFDGDGIYIFILENQIYIKRLQLQYKRLAILSDNPKYETWYLDEEATQGLFIQGKVLISQSIKYKYYS